MARDKKCPQCAEMVKSEALVCRFCGHQFPPAPVTKRPSSTGKGCMIAVGAFLGLAILGSVIGAGTKLGNTATAGNEATADGNTTDPDKAAKDLRSETAMRAGQALKQSARNPDSLVIEKGLASDDGKLLCVEYRAQNGFGGMNREMVAFLHGKPHTQPSFWNKHCLAGLYDVTYIVKYGARM